LDWPRLDHSSLLAIHFFKFRPCIFKIGSALKALDTKICLISNFLRIFASIMLAKLLSAQSKKMREHLILWSEIVWGSPDKARLRPAQYTFADFPEHLISPANRKLEFYIPAALPLNMEIRSVLSGVEL
jgi:hypothetical protein